MKAWLPRTCFLGFLLAVAAVAVGLVQVSEAGHDGTGAHIDQISIDAGPPGVAQGVDANGRPATGDRDGDGIADAEGYDTTDAGDAPGTCGNGVDDDLADSDADTLPDAPDGVVDDGCQVPLSPLESCIEIIDDGVLNADEDSLAAGQDRASIDITVGSHPGPGGGIPFDRLVGAWQFDLRWDVDVLDVESADIRFLSLAAGAGQPFSALFGSGSPLPDLASPFQAAVADGAGPHESGPGVLSRIIIEGNAPGLSRIQPTRFLVFDQYNAFTSTDSINDARVAVSKDMNGDTDISDDGEHFGCSEEPAPTENADVKAIGLEMTAPIAAFAEEPFDINVIYAQLHNNGPANLVKVDASFLLGFPPDCTTTSPNPYVIPSIPAPASVEVFGLTASWSVSCSLEEPHSFTVEQDTTILDPDIIDPTPTNNVIGDSATTEIVIFPVADLEVTSLQVTAPASANLNQYFAISARATFHNNGPENFPVGGSIKLEPSGSCPSSFPLTAPSFATLPVSLSVSVFASWAVSCDRPGETGSLVVAGITGSDDPVPENNVKSEIARVNVITQADIMVSSLAVQAPQSADTGTQFDLGATAILHDNGPYGLVVVNTTFSLDLPDDCTAALPNPQVREAWVPVSITLPPPPDARWFVTCSDASEHAFSVTVTTEIVRPGGVSDPTPGNDDAVKTAIVSLRSAEKCDGLDNDRDGRVDEEVPGLNTIVGTFASDLIIGTNYPDCINGAGGDDRILGRGGGDVIMGAEGADKVDGGGGSDWLAGGNGADRITGGPGVDTVDGGTGDDMCRAETSVDCESSGGP